MADLFKDALTSIIFPSYQNFNDAAEAYDDFIQKSMVAFDKVALIKERRIKHYSQELFDSEIFEAIKNRDKLLKKLKDLGYISIRNCITRLDIRYIR